MKLHATLTNPGPLTRRESDVMLLLCQGQLRKQIAASLHRSYGCVSKQLESIAKKLNAHSAAEIVAKAVASRMVHISIKALLLMILLCGCCGTDCAQRRNPTAPRPPLSRCHTRHQTPRVQRES